MKVSQFDSAIPTGTKKVLGDCSEQGIRRAKMAVMMILLPLLRAGEKVAAAIAKVAGDDDLVTKIAKVTKLDPDAVTHNVVSKLARLALREYEQVEGAVEATVAKEPRAPRRRRFSIFDAVFPPCNSLAEMQKTWPEPVTTPAKLLAGGTWLVVITTVDMPDITLSGAPKAVEMALAWNGGTDGGESGGSWFRILSDSDFRAVENSCRKAGLRPLQGKNWELTDALVREDLTLLQRRAAFEALLNLFNPAVEQEARINLRLLKAEIDSETETEATKAS